MTFLIPVGSSEYLIEKYGIEDRWDFIQRFGVMGYCGVDPIRIHFLVECNNDTDFGIETRKKHLEMASLSGAQAFAGDAYNVENNAGRTREEKTNKSIVLPQ